MRGQIPAEFERTHRCFSLGALAGASVLDRRSVVDLASKARTAIGLNTAPAILFDTIAMRHAKVIGMSPVSLLLNILWIVLGGAWMAFGWLVAAVIMAITIIGLPWARAAFNIAAYTLFPFGFTAVSRDLYTGRRISAPARSGHRQHHLAGAGGMVAGARPRHHGGLLAVTIIGIPFAWAHLKLAGIALWPIGKVIVPATFRSARAPDYPRPPFRGGFSRSNSASLISVWATSTLQRSRLTR